MCSAAALPDVARLAARLHRDAGWGSPVDEAFFCETFGRFLAADIGIVFGLVNGDTLVGVCCGSLQPFMDPADVRASMLMWYVEPEHRGGREAIRLFEAFETWAAQRGATRMIVTAPASDIGVSMTNFFERRGFSALEVNFEKRL